MQTFTLHRRLPVAETQPQDLVFMLVAYSELLHCGEEVCWFVFYLDSAGS